VPRRQDVGGLLAQITGHVDRRRAGHGAHWTAEQHRAYRAAHPDRKAAADRRYRQRTKAIARIRLLILQDYLQRHPDEATAAMTAAIETTSGA
jgi:hypothetical protein